MESFVLRHLKRTSTRLLAWLMNDALQESGVHDYVSEGYEKVSKACQIMTENEEDEREEREDAEVGAEAGIREANGA